MTRNLVLAVLTLVCAAAAQKKAPEAAAKPGAEAHIMLPAAEIAWKDALPSLPPGAKMALIEGDPKKSEFFALRLKLPAGYRVPAHWHPVRERVTVVRGTFLLGMGDKFAQEGLVEYPAGSYVSMPAGARHFALAREEVEIQLTTVGPWDIVYVDPKDDPRKKASR